MPILSCLDYYRPILQTLHEHPHGLTGAQLTERVAIATGLTAEEREQTVRDRAPTYILRIRQARYRLKSRDLIEEHPDDRWTITRGGRKALEGESPLLAYRPAPVRPPEPIKDSASRLYATLPIALPAPVAPEAPVAVPLGQGDPVEAPFERIERAVRELEEQIESDLLQRLGQVSPAFFERIVLRLLEAMGYGKFEHTGGPRDRGIDGILYADRLRLERVCVQAKRLKPSGKVPFGDVQRFHGALTNKHVAKGVFITSGGFTKQAAELAKEGPPALRLIEGKELAALMREFGVGVTSVQVRVTAELDRNFFDAGG